MIVYVGRDEVGRKRFTSRTVRGNKRQAQLALAALVTEVAKGGHVAAEPMAMESVLSEWLAAKSLRLSPSTTDRYRVAIKHIVATLGTLPVARLQPRHIEDLYGALQRAGQSGASIRKVHAALRQSLVWAKRRGLIAALATDGVELPPLGERKLAPPASGHVRAVVERALETDPDFGTLVAFLAWMGCRRGEVCGLRWEDLDLVRGDVLIRRAVVAIPGGTQERATKTGESRRLALGPAAIGLLGAHHRRCAERAAACGLLLSPSAFVFSPDPAGRCTWYPITRRFAETCRSADVPVVRLHDLRHHSATTLLKGGVSVGEVMDRHGWRTVSMVSRYRHLLDARDRTAAVALENATISR